MCFAISLVMSVYILIYDLPIELIKTGYSGCLQLWLVAWWCVDLPVIFSQYLQLLCPDLVLPNYRSSVIEQYQPVAIGMTQGPLNTEAGVQGSASILSAVASIYNINTICSMANIKHTCSDRPALTPAKNSFDIV